MNKLNFLLIMLLWLLTVQCNLDSPEGENRKAGKPGINTSKGIMKHFNEDWAARGLWYDGNAEVAEYDAVRVIYGIPRSFTYYFITVKEDFNRELMVKTDDYARDDLFPVMKLNKFARIETDNYPYHLHTSLFFNLGNPASLFKVTASSQEWCGNTFKHLQIRHGGTNYFYDSYFDGEGRGRKDLPRDIWYEDQLEYTLRALKFSEKPSFKQKITGSFVGNKATVPPVYNAQIKVLESGQVYFNDTLRTEWSVEVALDKDKKNYYWFEEAYPNRLLKMEAWDGRKLELKSSERNKYWKQE